MKSNFLKEYLEILIDLEKNFLLQNHLIHELQNTIGQLQKTTTFVKPVEPSKPTANYTPGAVITCVIFIVAGFMMVFSGSIWLLLLGLFLICGSIFPLYFIKQDSDAANSAYAKAQKNYLLALADYEKNTKAEQNRTLQNAGKTVAYKHELTVLEEAHTRTKQTLSDFYRENIIYPKYRNLPSLCALYEYIASGRAYTLEGPDGAYNLLEMELRMNLIITKLDVVIEKLAQIQENQFLLYSTMLSIQQRRTSIIQELHKFADSIRTPQKSISASHIPDSKMHIPMESSSISTYCAEQTATELRYRDRMDSLCGRQKDATFKDPAST